MLVVAMHDAIAPHQMWHAGRVYSAEGIGAVARRHSVPFLLDACQSAGQMPLDVAKIGCDWLTSTSRKYLRGPRGVGFLYASECVPAASYHLRSNLRCVSTR